jgi:hypothetical protein
MYTLRIHNDSVQRKQTPLINTPHVCLARTRLHHQPASLVLLLLLLLLPAEASIVVKGVAIPEVKALGVGTAVPVCVRVYVRYSGNCELNSLREGGGGWLDSCHVLSGKQAGYTQREREREVHKQEREGNESKRV